uniref:Uncharacterized protein n=1 Tax=Arundo donax TaxID=35708 RepID=A0A0A9H087_ARUDO
MPLLGTPCRYVFAVIRCISHRSTHIPEYASTSTTLLPCHYNVVILRSEKNIIC